MYFYVIEPQKEKVYNNVKKVRGIIMVIDNKKMDSLTTIHLLQKYTIIYKTTFKNQFI